MKAEWRRRRIFRDFVKNPTVLSSHSWVLTADCPLGAAKAGRNNLNN
jgi:hypothetical protein